MVDAFLGVIDPALGQLGDVHQPFDAVFQLYESPKRHQVGHRTSRDLAHLVPLAHRLPRLRLGAFQAQTDAPVALVHPQHLHLYRLPDGNYFVRGLDHAPGQFGNGNKALHFSDVDERAKVSDGRYFTIYQGAFFQLVDKPLLGFGLELLPDGPLGQHQPTLLPVYFQDVKLRLLTDSG